MLLEVNLASRMETATIEQLHRFKHLHLQSVEKLPPIRRLSRDQGLTRPCAFKEFRFEPPYVSKKKERRRKKLPPIPEHMLPRQHDMLHEELEIDDDNSEIPPLPSLSISPAFLTERDERSLSVEVAAKSPHLHMFNTREFTFPESNSKRKKHLPSQPSIVPALTPRVRDTPIQAKIEKLAKQRRKERAKKAIERRYEKKMHNMMDMVSPTSHMGFKPKREPETQNVFNLREHKQSPFKQMVRGSEESPDKPRINPRLYTRIVDSIYTYTKGLHEQTRDTETQGPYERLMVTPATARDATDVKDEVNRQLTYIPPIV